LRELHKLYIMSARRQALPINFMGNESIYIAENRGENASGIMSTLLLDALMFSVKYLWMGLMLGTGYYCASRLLIEKKEQQQDAEDHVSDNKQNKVSLNKNSNSSSPGKISKLRITQQELTPKSVNTSIRMLRPVDKVDAHSPTNPRRDRSDSLLSQASSSSATFKKKERHIEILVHNVSHTDMVLSLFCPILRLSKEDQEVISERKHDLDQTISEEQSTMMDTSNTEPEASLIYCRPRFSAFDLYCRRILAALPSDKINSEDSKIILGEDDDHTPRTVVGGLARRLLRPPRRSDRNTSDQTVKTSYRNTSSNTTKVYQSIISYPLYERSSSTPRYSLITPRHSRQKTVPVGMAVSWQDETTRIDILDDPDNEDDNHGFLKVHPGVVGQGLIKRRISDDSIANLRVRGKDKCKVQKARDKFLGTHKDQQSSNHQGENSLCFLHGVFFPLVAPLIPLWEQRIQDKYFDVVTDEQNRPEVKKVVILVTGVGTPRNWTHSINGNSTQVCAQLMELFLKQLYPDITVVKIHSDTNLFRYDENIAFAKEELMPCIEAYRDAHARGEPYPDEEWQQPHLDNCSSHDPIVPMMSSDASVQPTFKEYDPDWRESFHVTLSFADGSPARTHAIQASLRPYRPTYFHFWQLKSFWHESKISNEDIEILTFEDMETVPAMDVQDASADPNVKLVVQEMKQFKVDFLKGISSDIRKFWLRKTQKPVLAVLLTESVDGKPLLYRGTNMEVSMPTGSLCAERNVIGSALAANPGLRREDLKMVAVLAVSLPPEAKESAVTAMHELKASASFASFVSIAEDGEDRQNKTDVTGSWIWKSSEEISHQHSPVMPLLTDPNSPDIPPLDFGMFSPMCYEIPVTDSVTKRKVKHINIFSNSDAESEAGSDSDTKQQRGGSGGGRSSKLSMGSGRLKKKKVVVHSSVVATDINPLKPCGACNEWLKKIAEPNPNFKVLTFTDADCSGVYITPVLD